MYLLIMFLCSRCGRVGGASRTLETVFIVANSHPHTLSLTPSVLSLDKETITRTLLSLLGLVVCQ